jgi:T-complex protein 1 subunit theta
MVMPSQPAEFNVDNVRVVKILGGGVSDSVVVKGMVFGRAPEGTVKSATDCKVAIFTCPIDLAKTETKGTVVFRNAEELKAFSTGEEAQMEAIIRGIAETGVKCIVAGSSLADIALHYCEKYRLVVVRVQSKFEIRRLAKSVKAVPLVRLGTPVAEEIGHCDKIFTDEIGSNQVTVFRQEADDSAIATVVVRASTKNVADDIERAIDDGVNSIKQICRDPRLVPGCGATEMELARHVTAYGLTRSGLDQYAIQQYGISFEAIPRLLAESAGQKATERIADLYAAHESGNKQAGVDIESGSALIDASSAGLLDIVSTKRNALRVATEAATTILRIDQIIMARAAGGPKPPKQGQGMDSDD